MTKRKLCSDWLPGPRLGPPALAPQEKGLVGHMINPYSVKMVGYWPRSFSHNALVVSQDIDLLFSSKYLNFIKVENCTW